jgi:hypothetical protein
MKAPPLANQYDRLTAEERFRLIMAAIGRSDEAEQDRLIRAGSRISCSMPDSAPYLYAVDMISPHVFIDLLEEAAHYDDAFDRFVDHEDWNQADEAEVDPEARPARKRFLDLVLASGYMLRARLEGWKLFCERWSIPPFLLWEKLPGFDRLQRALDLAEKRAFGPEEFLRWLNRVRPKGKPELTEVPLTADGQAKANEDVFQELVQWWSGYLSLALTSIGRWRFRPNRQVIF